MDKRMTMVRIYISEADHGKKHNLLDELMQMLHESHRVHGVTVFRGVAGFGSSGVVHAADLLRMTQKLPLVMEFYDEPAVVEQALEAVRPMVPGGHIVKWDVVCECGDD